MSGDNQKYKYLHIQDEELTTSIRNLRFSEEVSSISNSNLFPVLNVLKKSTESKVIKFRNFRKRMLEGDYERLNEIKASFIENEEQLNEVKCRFFEAKDEYSEVDKFLITNLIIELENKLAKIKTSSISSSYHLDIIPKSSYTQYCGKCKKKIEKRIIECKGIQPRKKTKRTYICHI